MTNSLQSNSNKLIITNVMILKTSVKHIKKYFNIRIKLKEVMHNKVNSKVFFKFFVKNRSAVY